MIKLLQNQIDIKMYLELCLYYYDNLQIYNISNRLDLEFINQINYIRGYIGFWIYMQERCMIVNVKCRREVGKDRSNLVTFEYYNVII